MTLDLLQEEQTDFGVNACGVNTSEINYPFGFSTSEIN